MSDVWEYRTTISEGPLAASQLNQKFGAEGWELITMFMWPHGEADSETGRVPDRIWSYFKREKDQKTIPASLLEIKGKLSDVQFEELKQLLTEKYPSAIKLVTGIGQVPPISATIAGDSSLETGQGTDKVGVQKNGPAKVRLIKNKEKGRQE